ncbi:Ig-like domain-containing protein [Bacteroides sp.]|uniref:Ig-like domain-containing protein n=1 Tax=Bacteroides sp. TaxID=29523 RepID=UPI00262FCD1B|nr:Ig-like domain-containing protein [Bacteroides sp.]
MKKFFSLMLLCATILFTSCSNDDDPTLVTGISLDKTTLSLAVGQTATLSATIAPENASIMEVSWISCDKSIATVDSKGVVTGVSAGKAVISAITANEGKIASCTVTVTAE